MFAATTRLTSLVGLPPSLPPPVSLPHPALHIELLRLRLPPRVEQVSGQVISTLALICSNFEIYILPPRSKALASVGPFGLLRAPVWVVSRVKT